MRKETRRLVIDAMLAALYFVLSLISIDLGSMKITLVGLPVIVCGLLYGPVDGFIVGILGSFFEQMLKFGFTATTVLWILPAGVRGLMMGLYALKCRGNFTRRGLTIMIVLSALAVTTVNTLVWCIDICIYYDFYTSGNDTVKEIISKIVFGNALVRYATGIVTAIAFSIVTPFIISRLTALRVKKNF